MQSDPDRPIPLRVVVVDADERVRESLTGLLGIDDRLEVVGSAGRTAQALDLVAAAKPDIIVIDPRLPDVDSGRAFVQQLRATSPDVRVLVMCWASAEEGGVQVESCDGYVRKTFRPSDLIAAIFAATAPAAT